MRELHVVFTKHTLQFVRQTGNEGDLHLTTRLGSVGGRGLSGRGVRQFVTELLEGPFSQVPNTALDRTALDLTLH